MTKKEIIKELEVVDARRVNRQRVANLILQDQDSFLPLLKIVFDVDDKISIKACWILEFVCKEKLPWLFSHFTYFKKNISKVYFGPAVRPIAKICEMVAKEYHKNPFLQKKLEKEIEPIIEAQFDWMISEHKVAIKAYSMLGLFLFGKHEIGSMPN